MDLSTRIRDLRYAKGWGPDELANRAKISRTALYQIERGSTSKPQAGTLRRISRALGVPPEALLTSASDSRGIATAAQSGAQTAAATATPLASRIPSSDRAEELIAKFRILLSSPLADGVARIVEESFRLLPIIPAPSSHESVRHPSHIEIVPARHANRARSSTMT